MINHKRISSLRPNVKRALNLSYCAEKYWDEKIRNLKVQVLSNNLNFFLLISLLFLEIFLGGGGSPLYRSVVVV